VSATLTKLRRLKQRLGRPGRCPLAPPPGTRVISKVIVVGEGQQPRPEDLEPGPPCEVCGSHHDVIHVIEEVVVVAPGQAAEGQP
jgi:hypothetical protein